MTCVPVGLATGRRGQSEHLEMTMDMFNSGASNALPAEGHSTLHVSAPLFVQYSQIVLFQTQLGTQAKFLVRLLHCSNPPATR